MSCADRSRWVGNSESSFSQRERDADVRALLPASGVDRARAGAPAGRAPPCARRSTGRASGVEHLLQPVVGQRPSARASVVGSTFVATVSPQAGSAAACRRARGCASPSPSDRDGCGCIRAATSARDRLPVRDQHRLGDQIGHVRADHVDAEHRAAVGLGDRPSRSRPRRRCSPCRSRGSRASRRRRRARASRACASVRPTLAISGEQYVTLGMFT